MVNIFIVITSGPWGANVYLVHSKQPGNMLFGVSWGTIINLHPLSTSFVNLKDFHSISDKSLVQLEPILIRNPRWLPSHEESFPIGTYRKMKKLFLSETWKLLECKHYMNNHWMVHNTTFYYFVSLRNPRWRPSQDNFKIGPMGKCFKIISYLKPLNSKVSWAVPQDLE